MAGDEAALLQGLESPIEGGTAQAQPPGQVGGGTGELPLPDIGQQVPSQFSLGSGLDQGIAACRTESGFGR